MAKAFIFPGQGSQAVGMGKALFDAFQPSRAVFAEIDDALSQPLSKLMFEGPEAELTLTANAQPALMAVSLAALRALEAECGLDLARDASFVAGHSLGEYSALAAAGALTISDTARLLRVRGDAMQKAVPVGEGAMAALLGADLDQARAIAEEAAAMGVCQVANDNGGGQVVLSGAKGAIEKAIDIAKEKGIKRAVLLPVSAPFHCALMQPAADAMRAALADAAISAPCVPLVANVTAQPTQDPEAIRRLLVEQVTGAVRWRECVAYMADNGVTKFVECGSGKVLAGLLKRIAPQAAGLSVGAPADVDAYRAFA
ncbi:MAG: ACP S-malonyltransferase [Alphaproteobacteria bacterium]|nr:ACP S-malonyltransferase [Alphaproteobacteria bacterium]MBM3652594.1 ACP S-malonyltransferase [Alphaproteobacteria bacterium]